jgi:hypothetical protein
MGVSPYEPPRVVTRPEIRTDPNPSLLRRFLTPPGEGALAWDLVRWWERRRIAYNLVVGFVGMPFLVGVLLIAFRCGAAAWIDRGKPEPIFTYGLWAVTFGLGANLAYTGGWIIHIIVRWLFPSRAQRFGRRALIFGTAFSLLVTVLGGIANLDDAYMFWCNGG